MILNSYKSDFPNQVHQLNISISQHYFLLRDNRIKSQIKKFGINWKNHNKTGKQHLVTYLIRDHYSSCFYAEIHSISNLPKIEEFLYRAWQKKDDYEFWGVGHYLIVPKQTQEMFPTIHNFFDRVRNVKFQNPENGFSSGLRSILEWERNIYYITTLMKDFKYLDSFQQNINYINRHINHGYKTETNLQKWINNKPRIISPGEKHVFYNCFKQQKQKPSD